MLSSTTTPFALAMRSSGARRDYAAIPKRVLFTDNPVPKISGSATDVYHEALYTSTDLLHSSTVHRVGRDEGRGDVPAKTTMMTRDQWHNHKRTLRKRKNQEDQEQHKNQHVAAFLRYTIAKLETARDEMTMSLLGIRDSLEAQAVPVVIQDWSFGYGRHGMFVVTGKVFNDLEGPGYFSFESSPVVTINDTFCLTKHGDNPVMVYKLGSPSDAYLAYRARNNLGPLTERVLHFGHDSRYPDQDLEVTLELYRAVVRLLETRMAVH